jgi:3D (Asp-Asp-Asp) domain-containing protein
VSVTLSVLATAYCLTGTTATGTIAGPGTVAVDPSVIPLGSRLRVSGYGAGRALDTGGVIHGARVDLWMTCAAARRWGARRVTITVGG